MVDYPTIRKICSWHLCMMQGRSRRGVTHWSTRHWRDNRGFGVGVGGVVGTSSSLDSMQAACRPHPAPGEACHTWSP
jgi:hypothetical protein